MQTVLKESTQTTPYVEYVRASGAFFPMHCLPLHHVIGSTVESNIVIEYEGLYIALDGYSNGIYLNNHLAVYQNIIELPGERFLTAPVAFDNPVYAVDIVNEETGQRIGTKYYVDC